MKSLDKTNCYATISREKSLLFVFYRTIMNWNIIKPFVKLAFRVLLLYVFLALAIIFYYFIYSLVSSAISKETSNPRISLVSSAISKETSNPRIEGAVLAPVAFGNPFLPYRDVTPRITGPGLHGYTRWTGRFSGTWEGIDYATPAGTPLYAPEICPCVVEANGFDGYVGPYDKSGTGKGTSYIVLATEDKVWRIMYQHGIYTVSPGDIVAPGVKIGTEASVGNSTGPHTHVALKRNGVTVNVRDYDGTAIVQKEADTRVTTRGVTGQYSEIINKYSAQYNLDPAIVKGLIQQESGFNPNAVSPSGAKGLMQIMPSAQSDQCPLANLFDPEQNIACGTKHLRWSIDQMGGDVRKGIMAYHSGVGNQKRRGATQLDLYYYDQVIRYSKE